LNEFIIFFILACSVSPLMAEENAFLAVRDQDAWAIEQVMDHKAPGMLVAESGAVHKVNLQTPTATAFQTQTYHFQTETDQAKVNASITDMGSNFIIDISSDQTIQGWLLKRQSTREVFLRGSGSGNPYQCRIRVNRPYIKDFGLTVYVTEDSDPAFVRLF